MALLDDVCNPDTPDLKTKTLASLEKFIPKWFIEFLQRSVNSSETPSEHNWSRLFPFPDPLDVLCVYILERTFGNALACAPMIVTSPS